MSEVGKDIPQRDPIRESRAKGFAEKFGLGKIPSFEQEQQSTSGSGGNGSKKGVIDHETLGIFNEDVLGHHVTVDKEKIDPNLTPEQAELQRLRTELAELKIEQVKLLQEDFARGREIDSSKREIEQLTKDKEELERRLATAIKTIRETREQRRVSDPLDPKGYYKAMGMDPFFVRELSGEDFDKYLKGLYRVQSHAFHPDKETGNTEQMQHLNEAYNFLKSPVNRRDYSRR